MWRAFKASEPYCTDLVVATSWQALALGIERATASTAVVISGWGLPLACRGVQFGTDTVRRDAP